MIYTIGKADSYRKALAEKAAVGERVMKVGRCAVMNGFNGPYPGGSVWEFAEQAAEHLEPGYAVFGVEADWERDTEPSKDGPWHDLLRDAPVVDLGERVHA